MATVVPRPGCARGQGLGPAQNSGRPAAFPMRGCVDTNPSETREPKLRSGSQGACGPSKPDDLRPGRRSCLQGSAVETSCQTPGQRSGSSVLQLPHWPPSLHASSERPSLATVHALPRDGQPLQGDFPSLSRLLMAE